MTIKFNEVTWYSKLLAVILALAIFGIAFYLGKSYENVNSGQDSHLPNNNLENANTTGTETATATEDCGNEPNQLGMNECAARQLVLANKVMNDNYQLNISNTTRSQAEKDEFAKNQSNWEKKMNTDCTAEGAAFEGGSIQPYIITMCKVKMTNERAKFLAPVSTTDKLTTVSVGNNILSFKLSPNLKYEEVENLNKITNTKEIGLVFYDNGKDEGSIISNCTNISPLPIGIEITSDGSIKNVEDFKEHWNNTKPYFGTAQFGINKFDVFKGWDDRKPDTRYYITYNKNSALDISFRPDESCIKSEKAKESLNLLLSTLKYTSK